MKKAILLLLSLLISISALIIPAIGCDTDNQTKFEGATIIDDLGREVSIAEEPMRIVSLAPSNTEILFALGLGDRVFGVTETCNYPEEASTRELVGDYSGVDLEKIVAINPDLILAADMHKAEVIPALEDLGFTVIALAPYSLQETMDSITLIGALTGTEATAARIIDDMEQGIKAITDITDVLTEEEKIKVLYVIWYDPIMSVGYDTRIHELIEKAGGINIAEVGGAGYPTLALEEIVSINPQVIIVNDDMSLNAILGDDRLSGVDAVVNDKVYIINADLTNRPTPRIVEGLELMAEMIQPDLFSSSE